MLEPMLTYILLMLTSLAMVSEAYGQTITVDVSPDDVINSFRPLLALGAAVDRLPGDPNDPRFQAPAHVTETLYAPGMVKRLLEAGWGTVSYRQNTELFVEAWHWNPKGTWSDPLGRGYFTGDSKPTEMIRHSYGYSLPHRGVTRNGGTKDGFSRLDDGDPKTYWKSNPYLTRPFTGEDDTLHPQWVLIDLEKPQPINAIRITWAEPFARSYEVQYMARDSRVNTGEWSRFKGGAVQNSKGGTVTLELDSVPVMTRFVRILMTQSSNTCDTHGTRDRRNCLGYAIGEVYVGTSGDEGEFKDLLHHSPDQQQSRTYCSSVDPWHQASDLWVGVKLGSDDKASGDQAGLDLFYQSGITRGLPAMIPVAMLYGTPEDAAAQMSYLKNRGYPVSYVELGEEPDGQHMQPEDYGALYLQWATALHRVDRNLKLGGPIFQGADQDIRVWPDSRGRTSWLGRFLDYLRDHERLADLSFMSFEHYPFAGRHVTWKDLYDEPRLITHIMEVWRSDGLPDGVPIFDTETNVTGIDDTSATLFGAVWLADYIGSFFAAGGKATYFFHYFDDLFTFDKNYQIRQPIAQFMAAQVITQEWVQPIDAEHRVFRATSDVKDSEGNVIVTAYAVLRPDGQWSTMLINKDFDQPRRVRLVFLDRVASRELFSAARC
jgi:F5/8 type C domain